MSKSRIYKSRLYIVGIPQGISGFPKPAIAAIVTGARLKRDGLYNWSGHRVIVSAETFRLDDGRLPEFQATGDIQAATEHLAANPFSAAYVVRPEVAARDRTLNRFERWSEAPDA